MSFNLVPVAHAATSWGANCQQDGVATIGGIECLLGNLLTPLPAIIALSAVGMIVWSGIRIINAGSDPKSYESAWKTFTFAIVGLILLSVIWYALVLIEKFTGAKVTEFGIGN